MYRCAPEQVRGPSDEQRDMLTLLPVALRRCRDDVRERGAGNIVELDRRGFPPDEERETIEQDGQPRNDSVEHEVPQSEHVAAPMEVDQEHDHAGHVVENPVHPSAEGESAPDHADGPGPSDAVGETAETRQEEGQPMVVADIEMPMAGLESSSILYEGCVAPNHRDRSHLVSATVRDSARSSAPSVDATWRSCLKLFHRSGDNTSTRRSSFCQLWPRLGSLPSSSSPKPLPSSHLTRRKTLLGLME